MKIKITDSRPVIHDQIVNLEYTNMTELIAASVVRTVSMGLIVVVEGGENSYKIIGFGGRDDRGNLHHKRFVRTYTILGHH